MLFALSIYAGEALSQFEAHDVARLSQLTLILLSALFLGSSERGTRSRLIATLVTLVTIFGLFWGRWGGLEAFHLSSLACLTILWARRLRSHPEDYLQICVVGLCACYTFILVPRWMAFVVEGLHFNAREFFPAFANPRFFGHWVTLSLPLVVVARNRSTSTPMVARWLDVLSALWVTFVIASGTRGTWVALSFVTAILPMAGAGGRQLASGMIRAGLLGCAGYALMFWLIPLLVSGQFSLAGLSRLSEGASLSLRDVIWSDAWEGIRMHPLMGWGPMMFAATTSGVAAHPHSLFLQIAYEWGLPAALGMIGWFVRAGWSQLRKCRRDGDLLRIALLASIAAGLFHAQIDGVLVMPFGQTLFVLLCAWISSLDGRARASASDSHSELWFSGVRALLCVLLLAQVWLSWPELSRLRAWEDETRAASGVGIYLPRFWLQGLIPPEPEPLIMRP